MIEKVLSGIGGVGSYGAISVLLFLAVFVGMLIWVFRLKHSELDAMSRLPLEDEPGSGNAPQSQPAKPRHETT